jgi:ABC-2 type transport system permease protein
MSGLAATFRDELRRIFANWPVFSVLVAAVAFYSVFYPQPYLNEALRDVAVVVVDQDQTVSSRDLSRRIDASPDVAVVSVFPDYPAAQRQVFAREASGIVVIPQGFERDLLSGRPSPVALYADASYFLIYQKVALAVSGVTRTLGAEVMAKRLVAQGTDVAVAAGVADPMPLTAIALFNPQGGYASYLLPAAFILILQQTLLIGVGLAGTLSRDGPPPPATPLARVLGKLLAYLALEAFIVPFCLVAVPYLYGIPRIGGLFPLLAYAVLFVLAVGALGLVMAGTFHTSYAVQLAMAAIGMPLFFLSGFSWPAEAMPTPILWLARLVPSTSAIDGLVQIGQMGASLADLRQPAFLLFALAIGYGGIAVALESRRGQGSSLR